MEQVNKGAVNRQFLDSISIDLRLDIVGAIARHYERPEDVILEELTSEHAEYLYEYLQDPLRMAVYNQLHKADSAAG